MDLTGLFDTFGQSKVYKKIAEDKRAATEKRLAEIEIEKLHIDEEKARVKMRG